MCAGEGAQAQPGRPPHCRKEQPWKEGPVDRKGDSTPSQPDGSPTPGLDHSHPSKSLNRLFPEYHLEGTPKSGPAWDMPRALLGFRDSETRPLPPLCSRFLSPVVSCSPPWPRLEVGISAQTLVRQAPLSSTTPSNGSWGHHDQSMPHTEEHGLITYCPQASVSARELGEPGAPSWLSITARLPPTPEAQPSRE